jgi:hypothetical protein
MKIRIVFLLVIIVAMASCNDEISDSRKELTDGFCLAVDNKVVINHKDIDYYDFSDHFICFKTPVRILPETYTNGNFDVYADKQLIYSGIIQPAYSSNMVPGPIIYSPFFREDTCLLIGCIVQKDLEGHSNPDPRNDARIAEALARYHQLRE